MTDKTENELATDLPELDQVEPKPEPAKADRAKFQTVDLMEPIERGEKTIDQLTIRKPRAGELRGLALADVIGLEITALLKLIPRISEPVLTDDDCQNLDPADLTEIGGTIRGFFMTKAERQMMDAMIAEHQPKT